MQEGKSRKHVDETACGPLCQHPSCWASNRRVDRGLPRIVESGKKQTEVSVKDDLPTLKIVDLFGSKSDLEYTPHHARSLSAPVLAHKSCETSASSSTPKASTLRKSPKEVPVLKKIELHESFDCPMDWSHNFIGSHFYLWCATNKSTGRGQTNTKHMQSANSQASDPQHVHIKDVTEDLLPSSIQKQRKPKKMKNRNRKTPTGGRPYANASKISVPRSCLKSPLDDEMSQLLSLPKEILIQVIEHVKNNDMYDKSSVLHTLVEKMLPQIHFQQHVPAKRKQLAKNRPTAGTPLEESGILQNKKAQLNEGPKFTSDQVGTNQNTPFVLDNKMVDKPDEETDVKDENNSKEEEKMTEKPQEHIKGFEEIPRKKVLGPLKGVKEASRNVPKLTSVSTRTLSPLHSGINQTRPFNYSAKPLDWTLGPLPIKENKIVLKPVTPSHSEKASTLHVTIPSVMSPDRLSLVASATPRDRSPYPPVVNKSSHQQTLSINYSIDAEENQTHAIPPSLSGNGPFAPSSTKADGKKRGTFNIDSFKSKPSPFDENIKGSLPKTPVNTPFHVEQGEQNRGAIYESKTVSSSLDESIDLVDYKAQTFLEVDNIKNQSSDVVSQLEEFVSTAVQISDKINSSPIVTPALTGMTTPDVWPLVDEHQYLQSPAEKLAVEIHSPAAPPPSPEPIENEVEGEQTDERPDTVKTGVATSLTPLPEEEEEDIETREHSKDSEGEMEIISSGNNVTKRNELMDEEVGQNHTETNEKKHFIFVDNEMNEMKIENDKEIEDNKSENTKEKLQIVASDGNNLKDVADKSKEDNEYQNEKKTELDSNEGSENT